MTGADQLHRGSGEPEEVDPHVLEKPVILRGNEGIDDHRGNLVVVDRQATLVAELRDQAALTVMNAHRHLVTHFAQLVDAGQLCVVNMIQDTSARKAQNQP